MADDIMSVKLGHVYYMRSMLDKRNGRFGAAAYSIEWYFFLTTRRAIYMSDLFFGVYPWLGNVAHFGFGSWRVSFGVTVYR